LYLRGVRTPLGGRPRLHLGGEIHVVKECIRCTRVVAVRKGVRAPLDAENPAARPVGARTSTGFRRILSGMNRRASPAAAVMAA
jgi:hypothetical protein